MLVISRKSDQTVEFPELGVVIRVLETKRTRVQIGIEAPRRYQVMRGEKIPAAQNGDSHRPPAFQTWSSGTRGPTVAEDRGRTVKELQRIESQLAALAELANSYDRQLAREVAGDAMHRLARLRNALLAADVPVGPEVSTPRKGVTVAESTDRDRLPDPVIDPARCVREASDRYRIGSPSAVDASPPRGERGSHRSRPGLLFAG